MLQITPHMRILVAIRPADFRRGIDGLARLCRAELEADPMSGTVFVFTNRRRTAIKIIVYDGNGFWLCHKRLSSGRFRWWPSHPNDVVTSLQAYQLQVLFSGGDPSGADVVPPWRQLKLAG